MQYIYLDKDGNKEYKDKWQGIGYYSSFGWKQMKSTKITVCLSNFVSKFKSRILKIVSYPFDVLVVIIWKIGAIKFITYEKRRNN